jgi:hypothetical protein
MSQPSVQVEKCPSTSIVTWNDFAFNISTNGSRQWQFFDSTDAKIRENFRGRIVVERGTEDQSSDIQIHMSVGSSYKDGPENLNLHSLESALLMEYTVGNHADVCTEVYITVYLRPNLKQIVDIFEIRSNILDIWFKENLDWEIKNFITHTSWGETTMMGFFPGPDRIIAHNVSLSSTHGLIFGRLLLPEEKLELRNEEGEIGVFFFPNPFHIDESLNAKDISLSTTSGPLTLITVFDSPWPEKDYNHRLSISTVSGNIRAQAPHGSYTNYTSVTGDISCYLRPYGTTNANTSTWILTTTQTGNISVRVSETFELGHGRFNPMHGTYAEHSVETGKLEVTYGYDWYGNIMALIEQGELRFDGSSLEEVEREDGFVYARRGTSGESNIFALVAAGELDVKLGL